MTAAIDVKMWGLETGSGGELVAAGCSTVGLAAQYGTPLHVVHEERLETTARQFVASAQSQYPGNASVHYPFKCNAVTGVVETIRRAGLRAEVMTPYELELARVVGYRGGEIIANGPCKTDAFLRACLDAHIALIIVDSLEELVSLDRLATSMTTTAAILLRVNPDFVPRGMNYGSATGSRRGCAFGLDLKGGEVARALGMLRGLSSVEFMGFHFHIGTGIRDTRDHADALSGLPELVACARRAGHRVRIIDVGGGIASMTTRELTSFEMLRYQAFGTLPEMRYARRSPTFDEFTLAISRAVCWAFPHGDLPELIYEPGRCIASQNQFLLLTIQRVKTRAGIGTWLIADGGLSTVTLPTFYEYHEIILANDTQRPVNGRRTIIGPACFGGDIIYRNKKLPEIREGEVIAVMDTGAYFTGLESSFGFYRCAIVGAARGASHLMRSRETFSESVARDASQLTRTPEACSASAARDASHNILSRVSLDVCAARDAVSHSVVGKECLS